MEIVARRCMLTHKDNHNLHEKMQQLAYRNGHSMETVQNSKLCAKINRFKLICFLVLLDMLAGFDTIDHGTL